MLVDSHAHLQWPLFDRDREEVINRAEKAGVTKIVNIGFDLEGSKKGVKLAEKYNNLFAIVGVHPHNASQLDRYALNELKRLAENSKVVAIGEIGLDYYRDLSPREIQKEALTKQLHLAEELALPVVIHNRNAHHDILTSLHTFRRRLKGVLHCFSGSKEMAAQCIDWGFYISFAGTVTFPNARKLQATAKWLNLGKILLETDCPWLAPQEVRGKRNEPAFLTYIAEKIAKLKETTFEKVSDVTSKNVAEIFDLPR
ncbi:MAG: TatD family hydrolase [Candidatus Bathyarchaeota archaeon]|nr:MAG: TatD family hydrolase [Candidatus Bathyarchaeota archaeon]